MTNNNEPTFKGTITSPTTTSGTSTAIEYRGGRLQGMPEGEYIIEPVPAGMSDLRIHVDATFATPHRQYEGWEVVYLYAVLHEILTDVGYRCKYIPGGLMVYVGVGSALITIDPYLTCMRSTNFHYLDTTPYIDCITTVQELLDKLQAAALRYKELLLRAARERELRLYEEEATTVSAYCANCLYSNDMDWADYCGSGLPMIVGCTQREPMYCITKYPPLEREEE